MSKTIIIGGVAGGATTAARLRRKNENMEIILLEKGAYISYANCGLPYYIGGIIKSREALLLQTPEAMKQKFAIDVRVQNEAVNIDRANKIVEILDHTTGKSYRESYDKLVIATGSLPIRPNLPGIDAERIFTLWNVKDTDKIKEFIEEKKPKTAVVVGGGFIGVEMAENLTEAGMSVELVEMADQVLPPLDAEMAGLVAKQMAEQGVGLSLSDGVEAFSKENDIVTIHLKSAKNLQADMVILSIGVRPNSSLAANAGLALNQRSGIVTDEFMRTSDCDIYAVGDVAEVKNSVTGEPVMIPLAGPANKQARICADHISGDERAYFGTMGTAVAKIFDLQAASTGMSEKALLLSGKKKGQDFDTVIINQKSHAGYYPGAKILTLKLVYGMDGRVLGAQAVGGDGADKRIDVIAAVIHQRGTVEDLTELELSYAPPFSSAKDPVNMLGFVAENKRNGWAGFISPSELDTWMNRPEKDRDFILLDVTEDAERMVYALPDSYHIPFGQVRQRLSELDKAKTIITYCAVGVRSYNVARILMQHGYSKVKILEGGTSFYRSLHDKIQNNGKTILKEQCKEICREVKEENALLLDCCGLQCPGPVMKVNEQMKGMENGEIVKVSASDMGFTRDIQVWCERTGNTLIRTEKESDAYIAYLKKGQEEVSAAAAEVKPAGPAGKTMIVFDGDFDKVLASFIIANGAASMGRPVTMFFTFWGLNALRKTQKVPVKKNFIETMFGMMMPRGSKKLKLSNMNMAGMGTRLMKKVMKDKNVDSLEDLMKMAMDNGVRLVACTMSMDVMGIRKEELIDGVELAGVASYLGDAESANVNLFI